MNCRECLIWGNKRKGWELCLSNYSYFAPLEDGLLQEYEDNQHRFAKFLKSSNSKCNKLRCVLV